MLLLVRACLLWGLISMHVVGGGVLFHRLFPRESPWFGFIVPALTLVLVLNFVEHTVALSFLSWALPFTSLGAVWLMMDRRTNWRLLRLPTGIFLGSFVFTLLLRALKPDISQVRDGILDLHLIANDCMGGTLPATSTWLPPVKLTGYYAFPHYGASVLIRLFGLDLGTGYNISVALLSAFILFLSAAVAWRLSGQRRWVTILMPVLTACATTGSTAYLSLAIKNLNPEDMASLFNRMDDPDVHIGLWHWLNPVTLYNRRELLVPGSWAWLGCFHSTSNGQFLTLLSTYALVELFRRRRNDWPWIVLASVPLITLVSSSWCVPLVGLFFLAGMVWAFSAGIAPGRPRLVAMGVAGVVVCLTPMLLYFLRAPMPGQGATVGEEHTQLMEFLIQWWPIYLPWFALIFIWRELSPAVRIVHIVLPLGLIATELYTFGARFDMTGKCWGFLFAAAWVTFLPVLLCRSGYLYRGVMGLILISSAVSFIFWGNYYDRTVWTEDILQLEGMGPLRTDHKKAKLMNALSAFNHKIIVTGKSGWSGNTSPLLANLTSNSDYVTWSFDCDIDVYRNTQGEAFKREQVINQMYDGQSDDPLPYLRAHDIAALVIWPDDNITDAAIDRLKQQLAPDYVYTDFRNGDTPDPPNVGIFLYQPNLGSSP